MTIAQTILAQLGGNKFIVMTGAKNLVGATGHILSFKIGRNAAKVSHVRISLEANDTYTMKFFNVRKTTVKEISVREMVYADQLCSVFESVTGMYTSI